KYVALQITNFAAFLFSIYTFPKADAWWNFDTDFDSKLIPLSTHHYTNKKDVFYHFLDDGNFYDYPTISSHVSRGNKIGGNCFLRLNNVDYESFKVLNYIYAKDKDQVFFFSQKIEADADSFEVIDQLFAKDKNGIWYNGRIAKIESPSTFEIIYTSERNETHYAKDQYNDYASSTAKIDQYSGYAELLLVLKNSDPNTFKVINDVWAKDKNNVYWFGKIYKKADAATFEKISEPPLTSFDYAKDKNNVYIANGQTIKKALHGASFEILDKFWAKDNFVVYCLSNKSIIKTIDVETFKIIDNNGKAEDKDYIYEYKNNKVTKRKKY
ncbi:MAG: DKNYY domain-containing protein, partial [Sphingobacterium composti]